MTLLKNNIKQNNFLKEIARDWLHLFKTEPHKGMVKFIQFFMDTSGFEMTIDKFYVTEEQTLDKIVGVIEANPSTQQKVGMITCSIILYLFFC